MQQALRRPRAPLSVLVPTMPSLLTVVALALLQAFSPGSVRARQALTTDPLRPDTVLTPSGGPRIVLINGVGAVATLRISVPLDEGPAESGAGAMLREIGLERMKGLAGPVGARLDAKRTSWGLAYTVEGPATDLDFLAYLLRQAVADPGRDVAAIGRARERLRRGLAEEAETPSGRILGVLRGKAAPAIPPLRGRAGTLVDLDAARLHEVWWRSHAPGSMTVVVAADIAPEVVIASLVDMGAEDSPGGPPLDAPPPTEPTTRHPAPLRTWYGEAFDGGPSSDPHAAVAARLVADEVRLSASGFEAGVQLLKLRDRWLIAVIGAAGRGEAQAMREAVAGALDRTRARLTTESAGAAVDRSRRDLLLEARTPWGLVALVGGHMEGDPGSPASAQTYLDALARIGEPGLRAFMDKLLVAGPTVAEIRP